MVRVVRPGAAADGSGFSTDCVAEVTMMRFSIFDFRLPISGSLTGRCLARGRHDRSQSAGFFQLGGQFLCGYDFGFNQQFEPQCCLVSFFFDHADFGGEFRAATSAARRTIVRRHRSPTANDLSGNDTSSMVIFRNRASQLDDSQGKSFGSGFQFGWIHPPKLQIQSTIANRKSAIQ